MSASCGELPVQECKISGKNRQQFDKDTVRKQVKLQTSYLPIELSLEALGKVGRV